MAVYPKVVITDVAPNDPNDPNEYTNIEYQRWTDAFIYGFNVNNYANFPASNVIKFYEGWEKALKYCYDNNINILIHPRLMSFYQELYDGSRKYYPSVNVICSATSSSHVNSLLLDMPLHVLYIGKSDGNNNIQGYNIDFHLVPDVNLDNTVSCIFAGQIAWVMWSTGLSFWNSRQLLMRSGDTVNLSDTENQYYDHYTLENGWGIPVPSTAKYLFDNDSHIYMKDPFLLYKLRSIDMTEQPVLISSVKLVNDIVKSTFIGLDGNVCGNGAKALGVLNADTVSNEYGPIVVTGIALVRTGGAVSQGAKIQSNSAGEAVTYSSGEVNGYALDSATSINQYIRVRLS